MVSVKRRTHGDAGVSMIEATLGVVLLILAALAALQLIILFHGVLAAHAAATRSARTYAITKSALAAQQTFEAQKGTSLGILRYEPLRCWEETGGAMAYCEVSVNVPQIFPGAALVQLGGKISERGAYPVGAASRG